jgi:hypothetical protein
MLLLNDFQILFPSHFLVALAKQVIQSWLLNDFIVAYVTYIGRETGLGTFFFFFFLSLSLYFHTHTHTHTQDTSRHVKTRMRAH